MKHSLKLYGAALAVAGAGQLIGGELAGTHSLRFSAAVCLVAAGILAGILLAQRAGQVGGRLAQCSAKALGIVAALALSIPVMFAIAALGLGTVETLRHPTVSPLLASGGIAMWLLMGVAAVAAIAFGLRALIGEAAMKERP